MGRLYDSYVEVGPRFAGFGDIKKQGDQAGKAYAKALVDAAEKAAKADVRRLGEALAKARSAEADAIGKVRGAEAGLTATRGAASTAAGKVSAAEAKLSELRAKGAPAKQTTAAEAGLQKARDNEAAVTARVVSSEEALASAQRKSAAASNTAKDAAESLGKAQKRVAEAAQSGGSVAGGRFSNAFRGAMSKLGGDKEGKQFATRFGVGMNGAIGGIVSRSAGIFVAGFAAIKSTEIFGGFIKDAAYSAQVARVSAQAIKSTGGAAKITADQVGDLATRISNLTGADDETIQTGENLLLTFTNIRNEVGKGNDIFNQAAASVTDMAAALNDGEVTTQGVKAASIQLGKALNNPVKGVTALQKVGVSFTDSQKKQIETLVKSGKTMEAQKIILGELNKEFGGAAKAAGDPFTRLQTIFGNLGEELGGYLLPYANKFATFVSDRLIPGVSGLVALLVKGDFTSAFGKAFGISEDSGIVNFLFNLRDAAISVFGIFKAQVIPRLKDFGGFIVGTVIPAVATLVGNLINTFQPAVTSVFEYFKTDVIPRLKDFAGFIGDKILPKIESMASSLSKNKDFLVPFVGTIVAVVAGLKTWAVIQAVLNAELFANPIGLVVLAIAGLVAGLVYAYKHSETFRTIVNGAFTAVKAVAVGAFNDIKTVVGALVTAFIATKNGIGAAIGAVTSAFSAVKGAIGTAFSAIGTAASAVVNAVKSAFSAAVGFVVSVWGGIVSAVSGPVNAVIAVLQAVWSRIYPILALPFYIAKSVIEAIFKGIAVIFTTTKDWVVSAFSKAWAAVSGVLSGPVNTAKAGISNAWNTIATAFTVGKNFVVATFAKAWSAVKGVLSVPVAAGKAALDAIWSGIKAAFNAVKNFVTGAFSKSWAALKGILTGPMNAARTAISGILGNAKGGLQYIFSTAVSAISKIWNRLEALAKVPIKFIVNTVLNGGLIAGFNWIASKFDAPQIKPIPLPKGFATGGQFDGRLPGRPSAVDNLLGYSKGGAFGLASGEYVVNARQTSKNLPLLEAINSGDGFADGGLLGSLKNGITSGFNAAKQFGSDALGFLKDPVKWFKDRFAGPLGKLNELGNSQYAQIVTAAPRSLASSIANGAKSLLGLGGGGFNAGLAGVLDFVRSQVGKPYVWGGVGPGGYDCSGLVSAAINVARGDNPYSRLGATGSMPWSMFAPGLGGAFQVGWFQGNPGHTAATVNGTNIESAGGVGVRMGPGARGASNSLFTNHAHVKGFASGGMIGDAPFDLLNPRGRRYLGRHLARQVGVYDRGGRWPSGTIGVNTSGKTETVVPGDGTVELGPRSIAALAQALTVSLNIDGRSLDAALSRSAVSRGY